MHGQRTHPPSLTRLGQVLVRARFHALGPSDGIDLSPADPMNLPCKSSRIIALVLLASCVGVMPISLTEKVAMAQSTDDNLAAALKKFDEGRKAYDGGSFEEALIAFQGSYSLSPSPNSRLYIARCFRALGKVASAYTAYRFAAREAQDRLNTTGEKRYAATRDAANAEAGELEAKVPRLTIAVPGDLPPGFSLKRNGVEVTSAEWGVSIETDPGTVVIEAGGPRLVPFKQTVTLAEGQQQRIDVKVAHVPTATIAFHFKTRPAGLAFALDNAPLDTSAIGAGSEVDVGEHSITISAPGYLTTHWHKALANGEKATVEVELQPDARAVNGSRGLPKWMFFTVAGAAVASLAVASVIAIDAKSTENSELAKDPFSRSADTRDSIRSESTTANVLFVAGGVLGIGAAVLGFTTSWKSDKPASPAVGVNPWVGPGGMGLGAHGSF
jgi:hypothetical protein